MPCNKPMTVYVESGWSHKEITVKCGNTSPTGYPYLCETCEKVHANTDWKQLARDAGENWDEDY